MATHNAVFNQPQNSEAFNDSANPSDVVLLDPFEVVILKRLKIVF